MFVYEWQAKDLHGKECVRVARKGAYKEAFLHIGAAENAGWTIGRRGHCAREHSRGGSIAGSLSHMALCVNDHDLS